MIDLARMGYNIRLILLMNLLMTFFECFFPTEMVFFMDLMMMVTQHYHFVCPIYISIQVSCLQIGTCSCIIIEVIDQADISTHADTTGRYSIVTLVLYCCLMSCYEGRRWSFTPLSSTAHFTDHIGVSF